MDAASKFKWFLMAFVVPFGVSSLARGDDGENCKAAKNGTCEAACICDSKACCLDGERCSTTVAEQTSSSPTSEEPGIISLVSGWLSHTPKFSAQFAIHFGATNPVNKLGANAPIVEVSQPSNESASSSVLERVPPIAKPMKFAERIPRIQLGEFIGDVIVCGHRICSGNKCYDVKDEPINGKNCDTTHEETLSVEEDEPILVVPMAPPAPPGVEVANSSNERYESEASAILRSSGLGNVNLSIPATTVVDLLVAKTELSTRLEMSEQLMIERQHAMVQYQSMAERNAKLATQLAVAEARQQASDALTASLADRAEMAIKLASNESKLGNIREGNSSNRTVQSIQEDLSNIRRQIALLKRSGPVPFAHSYVGLPFARPYIPTAQLPSSQNDDWTPPPCCTGPNCASDTTVK